MLIKILSLILLALVALFGVAYYSQNYYPEPQGIFSGETNFGNSFINYGPTKMFSENLRFDHNNISYLIKPSCSEKQKEKITESFEILKSAVPYISFQESDFPDIIVNCSDSMIELGPRLYAAGEGGPSRIINTGNFNVIEERIINLYKEPECEYPVVELHELLHVFGFEHSTNPKNIMYNISNCNQRITEEITQTLKQLYSIEILPDAEIKRLDVVTKGRYLDFNATITNIGLADIEGLKIQIINGKNTIYSFELDEIKKGYARTVISKNIRIPKDIYFLDFIVDKDNQIKEINEENNEIRVSTERE